MKMFMKFSFIFVAMALIILPLSSSFMPRYSHRTIHDRSTAEIQTSQFYKDCIAHKDLCYVGNVLTDMSVIYYYTGRDKYSTTHGPTFCTALYDNAKEPSKFPGSDVGELTACAVGGCMHQPADIVAHNFAVPSAIRKSKIINFIIHVFAEQKIDNWVESKDPELDKESNADLDSFEKCKSLFITTMGEKPDYSGVDAEDLDTLYKTFISEIKGSVTGYDTAFKSKSFLGTIDAIPTSITIGYIAVMLIFSFISILLGIKLYKGDRRWRVWISLILFLPLALIMIYLFYGAMQGTSFDSFIKLIKPISNFVPLENTEEYYINEAIIKSKILLRDGPAFLENTEADGFTELDQADKDVFFIDIIIIIILIGLLGLLVWWVFKKNKLNKTSLYQL